MPTQLTCELATGHDGGLHEPGVCVQPLWQPHWPGPVGCELGGQVGWHESSEPPRKSESRLPLHWQPDGPRVDPGGHDGGGGQLPLGHDGVHVEHGGGGVSVQVWPLFELV